MPIVGEEIKEQADYRTFYPIEWLWPRFQHYERFGTFSNGLPMDDQDEGLLDDFARLRLIIAYKRQELSREPV